MQPLSFHLHDTRTSSTFFPLRIILCQCLNGLRKICLLSSLQFRPPRGPIPQAQAVTIYQRLRVAYRFPLQPELQLQSLEASSQLIRGRLEIFVWRCLIYCCFYESLFLLSQDNRESNGGMRPPSSSSAISFFPESSSTRVLNWRQQFLSTPCSCHWSHPTRLNCSLFRFLTMHGSSSTNGCRTHLSDRSETGKASFTGLP